ncbi:MAG: hypothetical protein M1833_000936 [Piccolia ochrophora]|nr:MAG: hypothetical protein M1833_000936 [Piccolia ochrophora]
MHLTSSIAVPFTAFLGTFITSTFAVPTGLASEAVAPIEKRSNQCWILARVWYPQGSNYAEYEGWPAYEINVHKDGELYGSLEANSSSGTQHLANRLHTDILVDYLYDKPDGVLHEYIQFAYKDHIWPAQLSGPPYEVARADPESSCNVKARENPTELWGTQDFDCHFDCEADMLEFLGNYEVTHKILVEKLEHKAEDAFGHGLKDAADEHIHLITIIGYILSTGTGGYRTFQPVANRFLESLRRL